jgi:CheY-like chemotaxis protein
MAIERLWEAQGGTVLIVDDDVDDAHFSLHTIKKLFPQFRARVVHSAEDLFFSLEGNKDFSDRNDFPYPILVLLDLKMAGLDGFDALIWLRRHPPHNDIPVIALTEFGEQQLAISACALGARAFLTKPLRAEACENLVQLCRQSLEFPKAQVFVDAR